MTSDPGFHQEQKRLKMLSEEVFICQRHLFLIKQGREKAATFTRSII
jgi:hypothetical protein